MSTTEELDARTVKALIVLLFLVQVPHVLHLPLWVSLLGASIVSTRFAALRYPDKRFILSLIHI